MTTYRCESVAYGRKLVSKLIKAASKDEARAKMVAMHKPDSLTPVILVREVKP